MGALLLVLDMIIQQAEVLAVRAYGKKQGVGGAFFNCIICLFAMVFFFITDKGGLCFPRELWSYGLISCLMFATGFYTMYVALRLGSYVATRLIASFSVVFGIFYGILFLKEPAGIVTYMAILAFLVAMFMVNYSRPSENEEKKSFSIKWLIYTLLVAISNGFIVIIMREQQIHFDSAYDNEFMIISLGGAALFLFIFGFIKERSSISVIFRRGLLYGITSGLLNGARNLIGLVLCLYIPISVLTPLRTGLAFISSFIISVFFFRESFTKLQLTGVLLGTLSLIMFNL